MLIGCPTEQAESEPEPISYDVANINYDPAHSECVMDIYRSADEVRPVVMLIHGGAWITIPAMGTAFGRSGMVQFKDQFLNNGYHVVNIDYRLIKLNIQFSFDNSANPDPNNLSSLPTIDDYPNDIDYTDMLNDIEAAVQFLYDNSDDYKIDTSNIVMYGYSAGAHLAELYSYKVTSPIPVKLCVGRAGPADFSNTAFRECKILDTFTNSAASAVSAAFNLPVSSATTFISSIAIPMLKHFFKVSLDADNELLENTMRCWIITNLLGIETDVTSDINAIAEATENQDKIHDASPIYHASANSPKTILLHGEQDELVPYSMATSLAAKLGTKCELIPMPHSGHSLDDPQDSTELVDFNNKVLQALQSL
ncbi:MAG: alpha/beta hydrolase [Spirochaetales bacterium]|nr:alpha/beta hydrolase [Spirochaetales bacterium]